MQVEFGLSSTWFGFGLKFFQTQSIQVDWIRCRIEPNRTMFARDRKLEMTSFNKRTNKRHVV